MIECTLIAPPWGDSRQGVCLRKPGADFEIHILPKQYINATRIWLVTKPGQYDNWIHVGQLREILATWFAEPQPKGVTQQ